MSSRRDRLIGLVAVVTVVGLIVLVVSALLAGERNARLALEQEKAAQLAQLARTLDAEIGTAFTQFSAFANNPPPWDLTVGDAADAKRLTSIQSLNPASHTGSILVDRQGIITNGTLLLRPSVIGSPLDRPGLSQVITDNRPALLPSGPGLTTSLPTIGFAFPLPDASGGVGGAFLFESEIGPDSPFNQSVAPLRRGRTDAYSFLDATGVVIASSDLAAIGKPGDSLVTDPRPGFHRRGASVVDVANVPSAHWRVVFEQRTSEFEGKLTGPLHNALILLIVIGLAGGGLMFFALLARLRAAREEQRRLREISAAREEFISIVSHELRTPATGQVGFLQTTIDHWDAMTDDERKSAFTQAFTNARRLHALTRDVLDTASIDAGELPYVFQDADLRPAVQESAAVWAQNPDHTIQVTGEEIELPVRVDPDRLQQVMNNLIENAAKNSPKGSAIDVALSRDDHNAVVEVSDRGVGMSDDERARVFEKFVRGRQAGVQGTGLGLFICRKIINAHGGEIRAVPREGGGSTFTFTLPLLRAGSANRSAP